MPEAVLVIGATGKTGSVVVRRLRAAARKVVAATRKPVAPGDVRFDWRDRATHRPALADVAAVYLVAPTDTISSLEAMRPFLEAASTEGVGRFVLLSASSLPIGGPMMGAVHAWLAAHAPHWTVLRPSWFMQNFAFQHLPAIRQEGAIYSATGDGRVPFVDVEDIAAVAVEALTEPGFANGLAPILTGPRALSYDEAAVAISRVAGRPVRHVRLTVAELSDRYERFGLPADYAALLAGMDGAIAEGAENGVSRDVQRFSGRAPNDLEAFLDAHRHAFAVG